MPARRQERITVVCPYCSHRQAEPRTAYSTLCKQCKLKVENTLTIFSTADIKGSLSAAHLEIPAGNCFFWPGLIEVRSAEIAGEFEGNLRAEGAVILRATARLIGDLEAGNLAVADGTVIVGRMRIGLNPEGRKSRFFNPYVFNPYREV